MYQMQNQQLQLQQLQRAKKAHLDKDVTMEMVPNAHQVRNDRVVSWVEVHLVNRRGGVQASAIEFFCLKIYMQLFSGADRASDQAYSCWNTAKPQHCISVLPEACQHLKLADLARVKHQNINSMCPLTLSVPFQFATGPSSHWGSAVLLVEKDHRIDEKRRHMKKEPVPQLQRGPTEFYSGIWSIYILYMKFERSLSTFSMTSLRQHL